MKPIKLYQINSIDLIDGNASTNQVEDAIDCINNEPENFVVSMGEDELISDVVSAYAASLNYDCDSNIHRFVSKALDAVEYRSDRAAARIAKIAIQHILEYGEYNELDATEAGVLRLAEKILKNYTK